MITPLTKPSSAISNQYSLYVSGAAFDKTSSTLSFLVGLIVPDGNLAGLGFRLHYDDTNLIYSNDKAYSLNPNGSFPDTPNKGLDNIFPTGVLNGLGHIKETDTSDADSLASTTAFINTNWTATVSDGRVVTWPGESNTDITLYEVNFVVADSSKELVFKFSASELADGYTLSAASKSPFAFNIDTDGTITSDNATNTSVDNTQVGVVDTPDTFKFTNADDALGHTLIKTFDYAEDTIEFAGYDPSKITTTLDSSGYDHFIFDQDNGESSVRIENDTVASSLKLKNLLGKTLKIDSSDYTVDQGGVFDVSAKTSVSTVSIDGVTSFKTSLKKASDNTASDPINLSDVLAQLKHIVGLKELKANALQAGDVNDDHTVNLSDVLMNLKHIIGLKEIDTFDLVTDNGFAINSLNSDSNGYLTLVINGDADQSHADWDLS
jgi:hypothetical protein